MSLATPRPVVPLPRVRRNVAIAATFPALLLALLLAVLPAAVPALAQETTPNATPSPTVVDLTAATPRVIDAALLADLDAFATTRARDYGIVGAVWSIARPGEVVDARGYGVRRIDGVEPVYPDTRFMIGSVTKNMTAVMAATIVDDGLASWETPLAALIPGFALADPALTSRVTLADSFCACTGLPRNDVPLLLDPPASPAELLASLPGIQPVAPFGDAFNYSNQMYAAGGFASTLAAGGSLPSLSRDYSLAMQERILGPLAMTASTFSLEDVLASHNFASPHGANLDGVLRPLPLLAENHFVASIAPAGALWSTAPDMARYLAMQLDRGIAPGGARIVSAENLAVTHSQRIAIPPQNLEGQPRVIADAMGGYALGWVTGSWNGLPLLSHSGGTLGFNSEVAMLPDANAGIVILTNGGPGAKLFNLAVQHRFFELLYGMPEQSAPLFDDMVSLSRAAAIADLPAADPAAITPFIGTWSAPGVGTLRISLEDGVPVAAVGNLRSRLIPMPDGVAADASLATPEAAPGESRYLFLDAPLAGPGAVLSLRDTPGSPTPAISLDLASERPEHHEYTLVTP